MESPFTMIYLKLTRNSINSFLLSSDHKKRSLNYFYLFRFVELNVFYVDCGEALCLLLVRKTWHWLGVTLEKLIRGVNYTTLEKSSLLLILHVLVLFEGYELHESSAWRKFWLLRFITTLIKMDRDNRSHTIKTYNSKWGCGKAAHIFR